MSCPQTIKTILRYPFIAADGFVSSYAIPGPATGGRNVLINNIGGANYASPDSQYLAATADLGSQKLPFPRSGLTGIGIAPDSAIHEADISFSGTGANDYQRHRIGIGNPLLGIATNLDFAMVSLPNSIPSIAGPPGSNFFAWDAVPVNIGLSGSTYWGFPLRLELFYEGLRPVRQMIRPSLHASFRFTLAAATSGFAYVYLGGRTKLSLQTIGGTATANITLAEFGASMTVLNSGGGIGRQDGSVQGTANLISTVLANGTMTRSDLATPAGMNMVKIGVVDSVGTAGGTPPWHQVDLYAFD